jgi:hypothetical protein
MLWHITVGLKKFDENIFELHEKLFRSSWVDEKPVEFQVILQPPCHFQKKRQRVIKKIFVVQFP